MLLKYAMISPQQLLRNLSLSEIFVHLCIPRWSKFHTEKKWIHSKSTMIPLRCLLNLTNLCASFVASFVLLSVELSMRVLSLE